MERPVVLFPFSDCVVHVIFCVASAQCGVSAWVCWVQVCCVAGLFFQRTRTFVSCVSSVLQVGFIKQSRDLRVVICRLNDKNVKEQVPNWVELNDPGVVEMKEIILAERMREMTVLQPPR